MELNNKIGTLNTYDLITKFLKRPNITSHISKHLASATMKPVDAVFSSVVNDSFIILKFQESPKSSQYFKYLEYSDTYDRLDISSSKSIVDIGYNNSCFYYILSIGNTFSIVTPNNEVNYETLILKDSIKLSNEIGKKYIIKISCGENHCLFLTHAGMIYTMGDNSLGQLGLGENHITKENKEGVLLKDLLNYRINDICAGKNHSFCFGVVREMTKEGNSGPNNNVEFDPKRPYYLFGWGDNSYYQLGMKQSNSFNTILRPTKLSCNNNMNNPAIIGDELINICCGLNFSALLFKNGKLLTFGDNQYNQVIYKENEITPNLINNYLPKKIGKVIKITTGGNSLMLMTEFNKLVIFGKYNEPNLNQVTIVDLVNNCENNKYIFNDNILKLIIFNNEESNPKIIQNITNIKINEFLVNIKIPEKNENTNKNNKIDNKQNNTNNINKGNESNNIIHNSSNSNIIPKYKNSNRDLSNKTLETKSSKKQLNLNNGPLHSSVKSNQIGGLLKKQNSKNLISKTNKPIKYKNSYTKLTKITSEKKLITDSLGLNQSTNTKNKTENNSQFNGAEKKSENSKIMKAFESNGKSTQIKNNENTQDLKLKTEESITNSSKKETKETENKITNGNNSNENGNSNQNIINNQIEIDNKSFLNKNILKGKIPSVQNRYEDTYDSINLKEREENLIIDKKETQKIIENKNEKNENNGGYPKNGQNDEKKAKPIKPNENINLNNEKKLKSNDKDKPQEEIKKERIISNSDINNNILNNNDNNNKIENKDNIINMNKPQKDIINNNDINKKNIDNNISNNSIKNINNFLNNNNINQEKKKLQNLDNNSLTFNKGNIITNQTKENKNNEINKKDNNNKNNLNNGINYKNSKDIQPSKINEKNNKEISLNLKKSSNNIISKDFEISKDILKDNNKNNANNIIKNNSTNIIKNNSNNIIKNVEIPVKGKINRNYSPIKINSVEKKEEKVNNNPVNNQEKKDNINIFRELGQFVSSTMNKINKYTKNRTDIKKDSFFENIISGNFSSNLRNVNHKVLLNQIMSGVPNRYRGRFWLKSIGNQLSITPDYFDINLSKYYEKYEDTKESKYKLPFPYLGIFKENTPLTSDLCEVINGFVMSRPDIKYNENISYLVGMLIINMDKYQAYVSFMNLILNPNIIIYYLSGNKDENIMEYGYSDTPTGDEGSNISKNKKIPSIVEKNLRRVIFKQLLFHNLPDLCSNLELINVLPEDYFDEWNQTIFCKNFNIDISMKIWDLFVVQGEKIIFDAGIAIMKELEDDLNNCEEKEEALDILLNSQLREINENNIMKNIQKVEYPDWIQTEVLSMTEDTVIPVVFNKI